MGTYSSHPTLEVAIMAENYQVEETMNTKQILKQTWDELQEDIYTAEEDVREAMERLRKARKERDEHIAYIFFGVM